MLSGGRAFARRLVSPNVAAWRGLFVIDAARIIPVNVRTEQPHVVYDSALQIMSRGLIQSNRWSNPFCQFLTGTNGAFSGCFIRNSYHNYLTGMLQAVSQKLDTLIFEDENTRNSIWLSSTVKKRRMKMNKHKLKKRRKALKMNTKASREA